MNDGRAPKRAVSPEEERRLKNRIRFMGDTEAIASDGSRVKLNKSEMPLGPGDYDRLVDCMFGQDQNDLAFLFGNSHGGKE